MTRLTDGKRTVEITMTEWDGNQHSPDWSADFFAVGGLTHDDDRDAYVVEDVDYCIEQAQDWKNAVGDFYEDDADTDSRCVFVDIVD